MIYTAAGLAGDDEVEVAVAVKVAPIAVACPGPDRQLAHREPSCVSVSVLVEHRKGALPVVVVHRGDGSRAAAAAGDDEVQHAVVVVVAPLDGAVLHAGEPGADACKLGLTVVVDIAPVLVDGG